MTRATRAQTRSLIEHRHVLVAQLREEIGVPAKPAGRPALVMLMGFPGVGKSHCARLIAARLGAAHIATDELRSRLFVAASYADEENRAVFGVAEALVEELLSEGHRVILDATNLVARNRAASEHAARARGAPVIHVLVSAEESATRKRLLERSLRRTANDHSDADVRVYERMRERGFEPPAGGYLEIQNGPALSDEIERIARALE